MKNKLSRNIYTHDNKLYRCEMERDGDAIFVSLCVKQTRGNFGKLGQSLALGPCMLKMEDTRPPSGHTHDTQELSARAADGFQIGGSNKKNSCLYLEAWPGEWRKRAFWD